MPVERKAGQSAAIPSLLLAHYDIHARTLPWRMPPGSDRKPEPYHVWLSEIMLQQTTVAAVAPYFERFVTRWPDVAALANAEDADVMAAWAGLGYYARARNLLACARKVAGELGGLFPQDEDSLRKLPGVGAYTAAAVAAIAFGQRAVVVDANVERVVSRLFAIGTPLPQARGEIRVAADAITPDERPGDFAQAMMDMGASLCSVKVPACLACPLASVCAAHQLGQAEAFPVKPPKKDKPRRTGHVWWLERDDGHVWLERRGTKRMLGGMRGLPSSDWDNKGEEGDAKPPSDGPWLALNRAIEHVFTHFSLTLTVHRLRVNKDCQPVGDGEWWPLDALHDAGLPTLFAKVGKLIEPEN